MGNTNKTEILIDAESGIKNNIDIKHQYTVHGFINKYFQGYTISRDVVDLILFFYAKPKTMNLKYQTSTHSVLYCVISDSWNSLMSKIRSTFNMTQNMRPVVCYKGKFISQYEWNHFDWERTELFTIDFKNPAFDTKNFDKIDYIIQIPLITDPDLVQTRYVLAMDYTLPPRTGLGIMDTALEHVMHYYSMNKAELIFCEMFQSVCLFLEFPDITTCSNAYNGLFQFFKTIFYVEDLSQLKELWICSYCKYYNQSGEYLHANKFSINFNEQRKNKQGDEYIYWCRKCKNTNHPSFRKIKYSYQKINAINIDNVIDDSKSQALGTSGPTILMGHAQLNGPIKFISDDKKELKDSTSSSLVVSSINQNLDLCYTILEIIQQESKQCARIHVSQTQKTQIMNKIQKLKKMLNNIQNRLLCNYLLNCK